MYYNKPGYKAEKRGNLRLTQRRIEEDMTIENPGKIIINFTIPIFIGNIFQL